MGKLVELVDYIKHNVDWLDDVLTRMSVDDLVEDFGYFNAALHVLQSSIQALIDLMYRIIVLVGERPPKSYSNAPELLVRYKIFDEDEKDDIIEMIGFRNILVHRYLDIDREIIHDILLERKYRNILKYAYKILRYAQDKKYDP